MKRWKMGLVVAGVTGALTAGVGLVAGVTWRQAGILLAVSAGKDVLLYLTDPNYRQKVLANLPSNGDTTITTKETKT